MRQQAPRFILGGSQGGGDPLSRKWALAEPPPHLALGHVSGICPVSSVSTKRSVTILHSAEGAWCLPLRVGPGRLEQHGAHSDFGV